VRCRTDLSARDDQWNDVHMSGASELMHSPEPSPEHLDARIADELIRFERSTHQEETESLTKMAMMRGLRHPRLAPDATDVENTLRFRSRCPPDDLNHCDPPQAQAANHAPQSPSIPGAASQAERTRMTS
jgi:hypothetical protein